MRGQEAVDRSRSIRGQAVLLRASCFGNFFCENSGGRAAYHSAQDTPSAQDPGAIVLLGESHKVRRKEGGLSFAGKFSGSDPQQTPCHYVARYWVLGQGRPMFVSRLARAC